MYYQKEAGKIIKEFNSSINGLSENEAEKRLLKYGNNEITRLKRTSKLKLLLNQLKSFIVYVLIAAALISLFFKEYNDAIIIGVVVIVNTLLGFFQEYKAEKAIEALQKLSSPGAIVIRDGKLKQISSNEVVPGDIIIIEEGTFIPADARLIEANSLFLDESTLTGESLPVEKNIAKIEKSTIISDQKNMVFAGSSAIKGRGRAIVISTGFNTELGKIAKEIQSTDEKLTPLQTQLNKLGRNITLTILILVFAIFLIGYFRSSLLFDSFFTSLALAVAAIPEGLPAIVTITLALGTQRMLKKNALMRKLSSVETLGSTTVICTDKTGTLTKNEMTVVRVYTNNKLIDVTGSGYSTKGEFLCENKKISLKNLTSLFAVSYLCNNASLDNISDPTEKALIVLAKKGKYEHNYERVKEIPFNSETKYMITINKINNRLINNLKGAPEVVLNKCKYVEIDGKIKALNKSEREVILKVYNEMAENALRVLGLAYSKNSKDFIFVGLAGMMDPPREEVIEALKECNIAGIKVVMITGDYEITAKAIASQIGIMGEIITGDKLEKISMKELEKIVESISICARVNPQHKVKILQALKNIGHVAAMTGDGVNDALALKKADIGIAVNSGTDVAKQASDMILLDNNFASIVSAIREGRGIYNNLKKFIKYLFSTNFAEVLIIFLALILGLPLPLIAIQILWVNLLTDGLPALALGRDSIDKNVMTSKPRKKDSNIIERRDLLQILFEGIIITSVVIGLFFWYLKMGSVIYAQTIAFSALVIAELFNSVSYSLDNRSLFSFGLFRNKYLWLAVIASVLLQLLSVYYLNGLFETTGLALFDWLVIAIAGSVILIIKEPIKLFKKVIS